MRRRSNALFRTCVVLCALWSQACLLRASRGEPPITGEVRIEGARQVDEQEIIDRIALSPSGRWLFGMTKAHPFDPDAVPGEARRIERVYRALGYYKAKVVDTRVKAERGRADVTYVVEEGPPTRVSERRIEGLAEVPPDVVRKAEKELPLAPGEVFAEEGYERLKVLLREHLRGEGYIDATLTGRAEVDREGTHAAVHLDVRPGERMHVGRVFVAGAQGVSRDRVAQATGLSAGQLITPELIAKAQRNVYAMGIFNLVQVDPGAAEGPGVAPVVVTVHEAPFIQRELGVGIVTDPTRWVGRVRAQWQHKNLARGLQQLTLSGSLGYAVLPGVPEWLFGDELGGHGVVADARVEFLQPRVKRLPIDASAALDYTKDVTSAFEFQRAGIKLGLPWHLDSLLAGTTLTSTIAYDFYFDVSQHDALPVGQTSAFATSGCGAPAGNTVTAEQCLIGYVEERVTIDRRDDPISAHRGWFLTASAQYAGLPGSNFDYLRLIPELRFYVPLASRTTLAVRGRWGMLFALDGGARDLPGVAKFFSGGANSVRVAGAQQIGPRDFLVQDNPDRNKAGRDPYTAGNPLPLGGNRLLEGSVELRMPTPWDSAGWVVFADAGAVSVVDATSREPWPGTEFLRYGVGVGLRLYTPVGPIRLDLAQRLLSWADTPVAVRTNLSGGSEASDEFVRRSNAAPFRTRPPAPAGSPETPLASEYRIASSCRANGYPTSPGDPGYDTQFHKCFQEGGYLSGIQFFLTIGEAF